METPYMDKVLALFSSVRKEFMTPALIEDLCRETELVEITEKELLLKPGEVSHYMYFVNEGLVHGYFEDKKGKRTTSWFMNEGNLVTSVESYYPEKPSLEGIQALSDCTLVRLHKSKLGQIYEDHIPFNYIGRICTEQYYVPSMARARILRHYPSLEALIEALKMQPWLLEKAPAYLIASYIGVTPEQLSRLKRDHMDEISRVI